MESIAPRGCVELCKGCSSSRIENGVKRRVTKNIIHKHVRNQNQKKITQSCKTSLKKTPNTKKSHKHRTNTHIRNFNIVPLFECPPEAVVAFGSVATPKDLSCSYLECSYLNSRTLDVGLVRTPLLFCLQRALRHIRPHHKVLQNYVES